MEFLEINVHNPIGTFEIKKLKEELIKGNSDYDFVIIDYGNHEFESIDAIKDLKFELVSIKEYLMKYKKVATISPSQYKNQSENPEKLEYFSSKDDAIDWFRE